MTSIAARDLRNHTADVLQRVQDGDEITITVHGKQVAALVPLRSVRPTVILRHDLLRILRDHQADPGLRADLAELAGDTTDDLDPLP